jgi:hypothetical protein
MGGLSPRIMPTGPIQVMRIELTLKSALLAALAALPGFAFGAIPPKPDRTQVVKDRLISQFCPTINEKVGRQITDAPEGVKLFDETDDLAKTLDPEIRKYVDSLKISHPTITSEHFWRIRKSLGNDDWLFADFAVDSGTDTTGYKRQSITMIFDPAKLSRRFILQNGDIQSVIPLTDAPEQSWTETQPFAILDLDNDKRNEIVLRKTGGYSRWLEAYEVSRSTWNRLAIECGSGD